jgi:hypothetical protein
MWRKLPILIVIACTLILSGGAQAARDVTGPLDTVIGVPDDGDWPPNELPPFAVDDQVMTKYLHYKGGTQATGIRVTPVAGPTVVTGLTFTTANDVPGRDPVEFELSGSNVSIDGPYTLIAEGPIVDFAGGTAWDRRTKSTTPIQFENDTAYEHYQLVFPTVRDPANDGYMQIAEIEFLTPELKATTPSPEDGQIGVMVPLLQWEAGDTAHWHDVYFGETPDLGPADFRVRNQLAMMVYYHPEQLTPGETYYWRIDEAEADGTTVHTGDVWSFTMAALSAYAPNPRDGDKWLQQPITLSWYPGTDAQSHDVYLGIDKMLVEARDASVFQRNQVATTFDTGTLADDTTYYWVVDEQASGDVVHPGDVWSFTTAGPGGGLKGEYFNNANLSGTPVLTRIDPEVDFNWGAESPDASIPADGWSARWTADLEIVFADTYTFSVNSQDGTRLWIDDELVIDMWVAWVTTEYASLPIHLEKGIHTLRLEFFDGGEPGGVDAVQQLSWSTPTMAKQIIPAGPLQPPLRAASPRPSDGATGVTQTPTLRWAAGDKAAQHDVYFGTDADAVANADTTTTGIYRGRQNPASYSPGTLQWNTSYYWRIDEVNNVEADSPWTGNVWSFTTADFIVVDDFEDYNDFTPDRVWQTWHDGYGYSEPPPGFAGNGTGSQVGNDDPPFTEQTIVHGGLQAMTFRYTNNGSTGKALYSETEREWAVPQDWTVHGVKGLSLWFYGDAANSAEPLYVGLQDSLGTRKDVPHENTNAVLLGSWQEFNIDLQEFANAGVNLTSIKKMYIGVGNRLSPQTGGTGTLYFDDIRVYKPRCIPSLAKPDAELSGDCVVDYADLQILTDQWLSTGYLVTPTQPGSTGLVAHYTFESNTNDISGNGNDGLAVGSPTYAVGKGGQAISLDGVDDYVDCGADPSLNITGAVTVAAWIKLAGPAADQKIAGNQDNTTGGYKLGVNNNLVEFEIRTSENAAILNRSVSGGTTLQPAVWYHVAGLYSEGNYIRTYVNGDLDRELATTEVLGTSSDTFKIGREPFSDSYYFNGLIDELRLYNAALSGAEIAWLAGRTEPFSEPFDFNVDGTVDFKDFAVLAETWLVEVLWP